MKESQNKMVKNHLDKYGRIDAITAIKKYLILRLAARISNLRDEGIN